MRKSKVKSSKIHPMSKKSKGIFFGFLIFFFVLVFGLAGAFLTWWWQVSKPINPKDSERQIFIIPKGYGVTEIAEKLEQENLIRNALAFKIMAAKEGISSDLQAGDFYLNHSMNLYEIAQILTHGTVDVWVTIPEGLRREEIAAILTEDFAKHGVDFDKAGFLEETSDLEGFLFPETYLIPKEATAFQVVEILRDTLDQKIPDEEKLRAQEQGLSFKQAMILASLVEREAKYEKDRSLVAGILIKRFKNDWPLQADASIQYELGTKACLGKEGDCDWWPRVKDTKLETPYNTYLNFGLPPAPICNPSLVSIESVLNPKESQYWFYLSDDSGKIHYAETNQEHEENIKKYLD